MEFQLSDFKSCKMMLWKCCTQYASKFGNLSSGHRTGKDVFIPIPKKGIAKECSNYHTIALISHTSKVMLKIFQARLQQYVNYELPDVQAVLEKAGNQRSNCQHPLDHQKSKRVPEKRLFLFYSVQFSRSVMSDSLRPHKSQHARPACPSPTPGVHSHSRPWDAIQSSHPLSSPSPPAPNPSQHQSLFQ